MEINFQTFLPTFSFHTFLFLFVSFDTTPLPPFDKGDFSLQRKVWKKSVTKRKEKELLFSSFLLFNLFFFLSVSFNQLFLSPLIKGGRGVVKRKSWKIGRKS
jgi:hypothetical protein